MSDGTPSLVPMNAGDDGEPMSSRARFVQDRAEGTGRNGGGGGMKECCQGALDRTDAGVGGGQKAAGYSTLLA